MLQRKILKYNSQIANFVNGKSVLINLKGNYVLFIIELKLDFILFNQLIQTLINMCEKKRVDSNTQQLLKLLSVLFLIINLILT